MWEADTPLRLHVSSNFRSVHKHLSPIGDITVNYERKRIITLAVAAPTTAGTSQSLARVGDHWINRITPLFFFLLFILLRKVTPAQQQL